MPDGENGMKAEHGEPKALETPDHPTPATPIVDTSPAAKPSEWTASDARGPLNEADAEAPAMTAHEARPVDQMGEDDVVHPPHEIAGEAAPSGLSGASAPESPPRRSVLPIAAGIVIGAIIGAGSAMAVYAYEGQSGAESDKQIAALSQRVDALQAHPVADPSVAPLKASVADLQGKVSALQQSVAAVSKAQGRVDQGKTDQAKTDQAKTASDQKASPAPAAFDPAPLQQKIDALQASVADLRKQTGGLPAIDGKVAGLATAVAALQTGAIKDLRGKVEDASGKIKDLDGKIAGVQTEVGSVQKQSATAQTTIGALQAGQKVLEGKVTNSPALAVVADSLVEQIDHGSPYATQVAALASIGADPAKVAVLKENADKGVPSAKVLAAAFDPLVDPIVATEHRVAPNAGLMDRLKSGMFSMVSIRRADDTSGDDLASHVARIQADLAHDDVASAYATWDALPPAAKAKSDAWGAQAKIHAEAMGAAHALQTQAISALGAKKS